jgi:hypothetical protein
MAGLRALHGQLVEADLDLLQGCAGLLGRALEFGLAFLVDLIDQRLDFRARCADRREVARIGFADQAL